MIIQAIKLVAHAIRYSLFFFLLFVSPVVEGILSIIGGLCLLCVLFCLVDWKDVNMHFIMWRILGAGMLSTILLFGYNMLVSMLAPDDYVIISRV